MAPIADAGMAAPPMGNYKVVSIALDLTGPKEIDEICQIGAYVFPDKSFSQYVMPHRDISRGASRTFGIRIFTSFGRFRVLKDTKTMKTLKTKSEYSTLSEFIEWLKEVKNSSDGVLLGFHDNKNQGVAPFLMQALDKYKMTGEFMQIVKGFVCAQEVAEDHFGEVTMTEEKPKPEVVAVEDKENAEEDKPKPTEDTPPESPERGNKPMSLKALAIRYLEVDAKTTFFSAKDRAEIVYKLLQKMLEMEGELKADGLMKYMTPPEDCKKIMMMKEKEVKEMPNENGVTNGGEHKETPEAITVM